MLGTRFDIVASFIQRSCDPNAFVVFEEGESWVRPTRKISTGKEITQCYTDVDINVNHSTESLEVGVLLSLPL